jgi:hypothetical protein
VVEVLSVKQRDPPPAALTGEFGRLPEHDEPHKQVVSQIC